MRAVIVDNDVAGRPKWSKLLLCEDRTYRLAIRGFVDGSSWCVVDCDRYGHCGVGTEYPGEDLMSESFELVTDLNDLEVVDSLDMTIVGDRR